MQGRVVRMKRGRRNFLHAAEALNQESNQTHKPDCDEDTLSSSTHSSGLRHNSLRSDGPVLLS